MRRSLQAQNSTKSEKLKIIVSLRGCKNFFASVYRGYSTFLRILQKKMKKGLDRISAWVYNDIVGRADSDNASGSGGHKPHRKKKEMEVTKWTHAPYTRT